MKKIFAAIIISTLFATACREKNEDIVKEPNKEGSIETVVSVKHEAGFDILTTTHKVWAKHQLDKTIVHIDTLKSLGNTLSEGEDAKGNVQKVMVPKDYEFYITVK